MRQIINLIIALWLLNCFEYNMTWIQWGILQRNKCINKIVEHFRFCNYYTRYTAIIGTEYRNSSITSWALPWKKFCLFKHLLGVTRCESNVFLSVNYIIFLCIAIPTVVVWGGQLRPAVKISSKLRPEFFWVTYESRPEI